MQNTGPPQACQRLLRTFLRNLKVDLREKIDSIKNDLGKRIDDQSKRIDDLSVKQDRSETKLNAKIDLIEKDLVQINTKMAVMESRLSDISTNVTYLMWHSQAWAETSGLFLRKIGLIFTPP